MQSGLFVLSPLENQNSSTNELEKKLSVFPNPFSDEIKILFSNLNDEIKLEIFDINGKIVIEKNIINQKEGINLKLNSGIYFMHIEIDGELLVKKLIRQ